MPALSRRGGGVTGRAARRAGGDAARGGACPAAAPLEGSSAMNPCIRIVARSQPRCGAWRTVTPCDRRSQENLARWVDIWKVAEKTAGTASEGRKRSRQCPELNGAVWYTKSTAHPRGQGPPSVLPLFSPATPPAKTGTDTAHRQHALGAAAAVSCTAVAGTAIPTDSSTAPQRPARSHGVERGRTPQPPGSRAGSDQGR